MTPTPPHLDHWATAALLCGVSALFATAVAAGAPPAEPADGFPHDAWRTILERVVDHDGLVDYAALARYPDTLDEVIAAIAEVSPHSHAEQFSGPDDTLAYYLNAYNALVLRGVLDLGPKISSVWGKTGTGLGFFVRRKVQVGGESLSLKRLEDDWVRAAFRDPRVHAALNCASVGCPRLPREPFEGAALNAQLNAAMSEFVRSERHVRIEAASRHVVLSKIFDWFKQDFLDFERQAGNASPSLIDYVNRYRAADGQIPSDYRVKFTRYDKRLNRQGR